MSETEKPYGKCQDCHVDLADRDAVTAHGNATMAPTGERVVVARGHRVSIINPTKGEVRTSRVRMAIQDALDDLCASLCDSVERGEFTDEEVTAGLWMFDLRDSWDDYMAEVEAP